MKKIHFIGVCGTLMGNAAVFMQKEGYIVRGSDAAFYPPIGELLAQTGLFTYAGYKAENLDWGPDLVITGNAISRGNPELERLLNDKTEYMSLPEMLRHYFIGRKDAIVVSGTHGKTSTTTMLAHVFSQAGRNPSFIIGGIPQGMNSGFVAGSGNEVILEGDEYDTAFFDKRPKFLHYKPKTVIINNIEFDHGDIYATIDDIKIAFARLVNIIPSQGHLIVNGDDPNVMQVITRAFCQVHTFGESEHVRWQIQNIEHTDTSTSFTLCDTRENSRFVYSAAPCGKYQIFNFAATCIAAALYGIDSEKLAAAIASFPGVKRRMELKGAVNGCLLFEDFAHHPTAITHVLDELRRRYPEKRLVALFEPRSNTTRRNIFQNELTDALQRADTVILGKIDREELLSIEEKLDIQLLIKTLHAHGREAFHIPQATETAEYLTQNLSSQHVCVVMSNGAFGGLLQLLTLENNSK